MSMIELVVIAHTDPNVLETTIQSITAQTTPTLMVVVDIGTSTAHVAAPPNFLSRLIETGHCQWMALPGLNRYDAINRGIGHCTGDYVMVLHEGDKLADLHVIRDCQHHIARNRRPDVIYGERIKYIDRYWYHKKPRHHDQTMLGMFVELSCMAIRTDVFTTMAFDPSYREAGDYAFVCRLMQSHPQARWCAIDRVLTYVVLDKMHEGRLARKLQEDWRVQRDFIRSGLLIRMTVLLTRLTSQLLRKLSRLFLGFPGYNTGQVPLDADGRVKS